MKNIFDATQKDHKDIENFINVFFNDNPTGIMVLDAFNKVLYHNSMIEHIFEYDLDEVNSMMGNLMRCNYLDDVQLCGTTHNCSNCSIRNAAEKSRKFNKVVKGVQINKTFKLNGKVSVKWLNASFFPFMFQTKQLLAVSLIDTTELVKLRMESELSKEQNQFGHMKESFEFHDKVLEHLSGVPGKSTLIQIEIPVAKKTFDTFGTLWKNEFIKSFYSYLTDMDNQDKITCACESDKFLIFYTDSFEDFDFLESYLLQYNSGLMPNINHFIIKGVHVETSAQRLKVLVESDLVHLEYFKLLSHLDTSIPLEIQTYNL